MPPFGTKLLIRLTVCSVLCLFVALVVSHFGYECRTLVLIASVPGHCLPFTVLIRFEQESNKRCPIMYVRHSGVTFTDIDLVSMGKVEYSSSGTFMDAGPGFGWNECSSCTIAIVSNVTSYFTFRIFFIQIQYEDICAGILADESPCPVVIMTVCISYDICKFGCPS